MIQKKPLSVTFSFFFFCCCTGKRAWEGVPRRELRECQKARAFLRRRLKQEIARITCYNYGVCRKFHLVNTLTTLKTTPFTGKRGKFRLLRVLHLREPPQLPKTILFHFDNVPRFLGTYSSPQERTCACPSPGARAERRKKSLSESACLSPVRRQPKGSLEFLSRWPRDRRGERIDSVNIFPRPQG